MSVVWAVFKQKGTFKSSPSRGGFYENYLNSHGHRPFPCSSHCSPIHSRPMAVRTSTSFKGKLSFLPFVQLVEIPIGDLSNVSMIFL